MRGCVIIKTLPLGECSIELWLLVDESGLWWLLSLFFPLSSLTAELLLRPIPARRRGLPSRLWGISNSGDSNGRESLRSRRYCPSSVEAESGLSESRRPRPLFDSLQSAGSWLTSGLKNGREPRRPLPEIISYFTQLLFNFEKLSYQKERKLTCFNLHIIEVKSHSIPQDTKQIMEI